MSGEATQRGLALELRNVSKTFRGQQVLRGINLRCEAGKTTVILGKSGSGKSVTMKHIIGLLRPDAGQVLVDGTDICALGERALDEVRRNFGMLFQDGALLDSLNVFDNIAFPLRLHTSMSAEEIERTVVEKLRMVGLQREALKKMPSELSGGMRKRVGLARAIALEPRVVLFDEPTTGLDPIMTDVINTLIMDVQKETGCTNVVISHDLSSAFKVGHQVAMLYEGEIVEAGPPEAFQRSTNPVVRQFLEGRKEGPIQV